jgi:hypothetical protein
MSVINHWSLDQAASFGHANLQFQHRLHERELASDAGLADILDRYPRDKLGIFTMGDDPVAWRTWRRGVAEGLSGAELVEAVKRGRIWLNLRAVNAHDAGYAELSDEIFADVEEGAGQRTFRRDVGLLISSPAVQVFYHLDVPLVMLWQLRGTKTVWLYPPHAPYVDDPQLERIVLKESAEQFAYDPAWDAGAERVVLEPGRMVTWPQNAPHRIENGDMMNVSLSIEFMTTEAMMRANVLYANGMLRKTFGAKPEVQALPDPRAIAKLGAARAWKALRPGDKSRDPLPATFSLVRSEPGAIAAL